MTRHMTYDNGPCILILQAEQTLCLHSLYSEKVTIVAIGLKFAMSVHTSFRSVCRKSGLIMLVDSEVVAACVQGNYEKCVRARKSMGLSMGPLITELF